MSKVIAPKNLSIGSGKIVKEVVVPKTSVSQASWSQVFNEISGKAEYTEIQGIQDRLSKPGPLSAKELLSYQIRVGRFGVKVELLSKLADTMVQGIKKFQNGQG